MIGETVIDANVAVPSSDADSLLSSPDGNIPGKADGANDAGNDGAAQAAAEAAAEAAKAAEGAKGGDDDRFDKHPRFQELRDRAIKAEAKVAIFEKSPLNPAFVPPAGDEDGEIKDTSKMSAEEIREWMEDDPVGFNDNLLKLAVTRVKQTMKGESMRDQTVSGITKTFEDYAAANPTFNDMWESGEIEKYMNEHPGHNAISAHMALNAGTGQADIQKKIDEAVAKAIKDTEAKAIKNFQAKRSATVISSGAGSTARGTADGIDPALQDTNKYGGLTTVLADKLAARRRAAVG